MKQNMGNKEEEIEVGPKYLKFQFILKHGNAQLAVGNLDLKGIRKSKLKK